MCRGSGAAPNDAMAEAPDDGEDWDAQFDAIFDNVRGLVDNDSLHDSDSVTTMSPRLEAVYDCSPAGSDHVPTPREPVAEEVAEDVEVVFTPAEAPAEEVAEEPAADASRLGAALRLEGRPGALEGLTRAERAHAVTAAATRVAEAAEAAGHAEGDGGALAVLRVVARLLRGDATVARCRGGEYGGGRGLTSKISEERFAYRVRARRSAAAVVEAALRPDRVDPKPAPFGLARERRDDLRRGEAPAARKHPPAGPGHKLLRKSLLGGMFAVQAKAGGADLAERRFRKNLGLVDGTESSAVPGYENGAFVFLWSFREWVPCRVERMRMASAGPGEPKVSEVLLHELGRDDLSDKWIPVASPRIRTVVNTCVPSRRRGDLPKPGTRVRSSWSARDEAHFWKARGPRGGPAGTVIKLAPERDAAQVELEGLLATERLWLPLHALRALEASDDGGAAVAARARAADLVRAAISQHEPVRFGRVVTRVMRGQRALVSLSYEDESRGLGPEKIAWTVCATTPGRKKREDPGALFVKQIEQEEAEIRAHRDAQRHDARRHAFAEERHLAGIHADGSGGAHLNHDIFALLEEDDSDVEGELHEDELHRHRATWRVISDPDEPRHANGLWAGAPFLRKRVPDQLVKELGFKPEVLGDRAWTDDSRARLCDAVAPRLDVCRGALVFARSCGRTSTELASVRERKWEQHVYCHLKDVPSFLTFRSVICPRGYLELVCALAWRADAGDGAEAAVRGEHAFTLELGDWAELGYGAHLEWLDDAERRFLCRALTMRLESRHGAPVFLVEKSKRVLWPTPESRCAFPPGDGAADVPLEEPCARTGSSRSGPCAPGPHGAADGEILWRSVARLATPTASARDVEDDGLGRVSMQRWLVSARRDGGAVALQAKHVPSGATAYFRADAGHWCDLGRLRAPLQWLSRQQQRGLAARFIDLGLVDHRTAGLRQRVEGVVGSELRARLDGRGSRFAGGKPRVSQVEKDALSMAAAAKKSREDRRRRRESRARRASRAPPSDGDDASEAEQSQASGLTGDDASQASREKRAEEQLAVADDLGSLGSVDSADSGNRAGNAFLKDVVVAAGQRLPSFIDETELDRAASAVVPDDSDIPDSIYKDDNHLFDTGGHVVRADKEKPPEREEEKPNLDRFHEGETREEHRASELAFENLRRQEHEHDVPQGEQDSLGDVGSYETFDSESLEEDDDASESESDDDDDAFEVSHAEYAWARDFIAAAGKPGVLAKNAHRNFVKGERHLVDRLTSRKAKKVLKGGGMESPQGKFTVAAAAAKACAREAYLAKNAMKQEKLEHSMSRPGQEKRANFPTSKAHISAVFHSFWLISGRTIISRNGLEAWMLFPERARAEH